MTIPAGVVISPLAITFDGFGKAPPVREDDVLITDMPVIRLLDQKPINRNVDGIPVGAEHADNAQK